MGFIVATLIVLAVIASTLAQDFSVFSLAYWQEGGSDTSRSEVSRNFLLALIALGALIVGSIRARSAHRQARAANEQARIAEQGQFTERFSRAAEHLGSDQLPVRLGGIYALWRLAEDSPERDAVPVIDILCAFVRDPPPAEPPPAEPPPAELLPSTEDAEAAQPVDTAAKLRPDVQAVLKLLSDRSASYRLHLSAEYRFDLTRSDLAGAVLTRANLTDFDLFQANLTNANLTDANLTGANLTWAIITRALLLDANLTNARLEQANLSGDSLWRANLTRADLMGADLRCADLSEANLTNARLRFADLRGANLSEANLMNTRLEQANLSGAHLKGVENLTQQLVGRYPLRP